MKEFPITKSQIDFIRPRIEHGGWYYTAADKDVIANNAIDDIEVCLQRIDELEETLNDYQTKSAFKRLDPTLRRDLQQQTERADAAVARVCELLDFLSKKDAEIDRLQKRVDELEAWQKWAQELMG